jgi:predicted DNA-binding transcriptional regulator AlpA
VPLAHVQRAAAKGKWRAAAWFLEYRFPADWALNWRGDAARARLASPPGPAVSSTAEVEGRARSGNGRIPSKLAPELEARLCQALRVGAFPADAAAYAGISRSTLYRWLKAGREPGAEPRLAAFAVAVRQAEAHAVIAALEVIFRCGAEGDWRAACWWLERMYPDDWGPVDQLGHRRFGRRPEDGRLERLC